MKYALGNMLNGAGGLNADGLSLDLQFATDKTLTARKGPTPTFTRASNATVVNSDGLVQLAGSNVSLYSGALVIGTGWVAGGTTSVISGTGPDGNNSYAISEDATLAPHAFSNSGGLTGSGATSVVSGTTYTASVFLKKVSGNIDWIQLTCGSAGFGTTPYANVNIGNGTVGNSAGLAAGTSLRIEAFSNGWYRCSISVVATTTTTTSNNITIGFTNNTNVTTRLPSYAGSTANKVLAAMGQFQQGTVATTYLPTTTAAVYAPRFDHDPVTLACKGLLIEESRTNAALYSGALVIGTGWTATASTSTVDGLGPDGNNAYEIAETAAAGSHSLINTGGVGATAATSVVSGTTYTGSIFVKKVAGSIDWVQLTFSVVGFGSTQYVNFNIGAGTVGNFAGLASGTSPRIESYGNGWYRCSISATATATTSASSNVFAAFADNTNGITRLPSYVGSTANKVLAAMCQFEAGSFATSYIPTTTASAIRSADVCSITGADFSGMWNALEGSVFTSVIFNAPVAYANAQSIIDVNDTTVANRLRIVRNGTTGLMSLSNTSSNSQNVSISSASAAQPFIQLKASTGFKLNDYAFYVNNSQVGTDNVGTMIVLPTTLSIGDFSAGAGTRPTNGTISSIRYYKQRLSDSKLQAITV